MKKIIKIMIISILIMMSICLPVRAEGEMTQLRLTVIDAKEDYDMYILLPKNYIKYAIKHDNLDIEYDKANTLKYNSIPSITTTIENIQDDVYVEDMIEYVQIKLDDLGDQLYVFEIISEYTDMDMLFRVKSESKDDLLVIQNFKVQDNACKIEYNYKENTIQTERKNEMKISFRLQWWQIALIAVLIVFIVYLQKRRRY